MMKEERILRKHLSFLKAITTEGKSEHRITMRLITALVRAVRADERERCAKVADTHAKGFAEFATRAKKKGHNVDDIVARRIASEDIAAAIRRKGK